MFGQTCPPPPTACTSETVEGPQPLKVRSRGQAQDFYRHGSLRALLQRVESWSQRIAADWLLLHQALFLGYHNLAAGGLISGSSRPEHHAVRFKFPPTFNWDSMGFMRAAKLLATCTGGNMTNMFPQILAACRRNHAAPHPHRQSFQEGCQFEIQTAPMYWNVHYDLASRKLRTCRDHRMNVNSVVLTDGRRTCRQHREVCTFGARIGPTPYGQRHFV